MRKRIAGFDAAEADNDARGSNRVLVLLAQLSFAARLR